jgi:hypothetical protein
MVRWLWRNKAGNFVENKLGAKIVEPVLSTGTLQINNEPYKAGKLVCKSGEYWQWKYVSRPFGTRCLYLNFGWLLDAFVEVPDRYPKARFLCQIQFATRK